eukprot:GHVU01138958.1.p1 GENE.GHVU01138958.1~~GHVU01138958.1.p1  ORF type:complete len:228 (+),score=20.12 GHVU01138958.1:850-1533(+)
MLFAEVRKALAAVGQLRGRNGSAGGGGARGAVDTGAKARQLQRREDNTISRNKSSAAAPLPRGSAAAPRHVSLNDQASSLAVGPPGWTKEGREGPTGHYRSSANLRGGTHLAEASRKGGGRNHKSTGSLLQRHQGLRDPEGAVEKNGAQSPNSRLQRGATNLPVSHTTTESQYGKKDLSKSPVMGIEEGRRLLHSILTNCEPVRMYVCVCVRAYAFMYAININEVNK